MSTDRSAVSVLPSGLLVIQNMDTAIPDSYQTPPLPLPFSLSFNSSESSSRGFETNSDKSDLVLYENAFTGFKDLKLPTFKADEDKSSALNSYSSCTVEEDDVCPTCLEGIRTSLVNL